MGTKFRQTVKPTDLQHAAPIILGKLLNIGGMLQRHGDRLLRPFGLNQTQFSILFEIARAQKSKQKEMVNRLALGKAHVSKAVKKLKEMGLITVMTSESDKRSSWLEQTREGAQLIERCMEVFEKWNGAWVGAFSEDELRSILGNLTKLQAVFTARTKINE